MKNRRKILLEMAAMVVMALTVPVPVMADWVVSHEHVELWGAGSAVTLAEVTIADLDGDGSEEIITIGTTTSSGGDHAELRVANWNDDGYTLRTEVLWQIDDLDTLGKQVVCGDLDDDGTVDILTAAQNRPADRHELRVWHWDTGTGSLTSEVQRVFDSTGIESMAAADVDGDGRIEILTGESALEILAPRMRLVRVEGGALVEEHVETWEVTGRGSPIVQGLAPGDVDGDGNLEIVTAVTLAEGFELRVWQWDGTSLHLEASEEWDTLDGTDASDVVMANLNEHPFPEIVVIGTATNRANPDHPFYGCVSVWTFDGAELNFIDHDTWQSALGMVEFLDGAAVDLPSLADYQIVLAGPLHEHPARNVIRAYRLNDAGKLESLFTEEWMTAGMTNSYAYAVTAGDVDGDGQVEIIACGRSSETTVSSNHEMDILSVWYQVRIPGYLDWLKNVLGFERWPLFLALSDALPMPWPIVIYSFILVAALVFVTYGIVRMVNIIRRPREEQPPSHR